MKENKGLITNYYFQYKDFSQNFFRPRKIATKNPSDICLADGISVVGDYEYYPCGIWTTSHIVKVNENTAETANSIYQLGNPHKDYVEMIEAYQSGIPIVGNWYFLDPHHSNSYYFYGEDTTGKEVYGTIINQTGNFLTIRNKENPHQEIFVCWPDAADKATYSITATMIYNHEIPGIELIGTENAFGHDVRLRLYSTLALW